MRLDLDIVIYSHCIIRGANVQHVFISRYPDETIQNIVQTILYAKFCCGTMIYINGTALHLTDCCPLLQQSGEKDNRGWEVGQRLSVLPLIEFVGTW